MLVQTPRIGEHGYIPSKDLGLVDAGPAQVRPITTIGQVADRDPLPVLEERQDRARTSERGGHVPTAVRQSACEQPVSASTHLT